MTGYQKRLFGVIATAWLADQVDAALPTFLLGSITLEFHLTSVQIGVLASMTFLGQLVGNILAGSSSDLFGRKMTFQWTMVVWGLASFLAAMSWSAGALMFFRFLIGVGVGGEAPVAQAMVSEFVPAKSAREIRRDHGRLLGGRLRALRRHQLLRAADRGLALGVRGRRLSRGLRVRGAPHAAGITTLARRQAQI